MGIQLYTRHNEVPILREHDSTVKANYYNHVQIALHRLGQQIRFRIPKLKHLDLILQKDAWIVVDRVLNDVPVVAWMDFQAEHRENLHEPIKCHIRYWHAAATMIKSRTLEEMDSFLTEELAEKITNDHFENTTIIPFPGKGKHG